MVLQVITLNDQKKDFISKPMQQIGMDYKGLWRRRREAMVPKNDDNFFNGNGYGFWKWKPLIVLDKLSKFEAAI